MSLRKIGGMSEGWSVACTPAQFVLMVFVLPKLLVYNVDAMKSYATFSDLSARECRVCAETTTQNVFITVSVAFSEGPSPSWPPW